MSQDLQSVYSAILRRGHRSVPTYNDVRRDVRVVLEQQARVLI